MTDFLSFQNRWTITGDLELETPLQIGGGQNAAGYSITTTPVIQRWSDEYGGYIPFIPGSSLKGALRSTAERLVRSFNRDQCCCSLTEDRNETKLCGKCICCRIFGSMAGGSMVRVRDAEISQKLPISGSDRVYLAERPHFGKPGHLLQQGGQREGLFRVEEVIAPGTRFSFRIDVDNAEPSDVGLLLLALDEFSHRRAFLGGAASRGSGFVQVKGVRVSRTTLDGVEIINEAIQLSELVSRALEWLSSIMRPDNFQVSTFDCYRAAHNDDEDNRDGHEVVQIDCVTKTPFKMPGVDEETVTGGGGIPVIPGSVIKGYLWRTLMRNGVGEVELKDIFGDVSHRSRILCSDAYNDQISANNEIPKGRALRFYLVMDNMTNDQKELVLDALSKDKEILLTGKTSSNMASGGNGNLIVVKERRASLFRISRYLKMKQKAYGLG